MGPYSELLSKALLTERDKFSEALYDATQIDGNDKNWTRLEETMTSLKDCFYYIIYSSDDTLGIDSNHNIFVRNDIALKILKNSLEKTKKKLDVALAWAYAIPAILILMRILDFFR